MHWTLLEYVLKGVFLGLLLCAALVAPGSASAWPVAVWLLAGLTCGLLVAAIFKLRGGYRVGSRPIAFALFLLLESPSFVFAGTLLGLLLGALSVVPAEQRHYLALAVVGGAALGLGLAGLRTIRDAKRRRLVALGAGASLVAAGVLLVTFYPDWFSDERQHAIGTFLLLGLPFFYLLTFVGEAEESEVEVAAWCAALALALFLIRLTPQMPTLALLIPLGIFFVYSRSILPGLRVFKYSLRGLSYARLERYQPALRALRRAIELDPDNKLARETLWDLHRSLDPVRLSTDETLRGLIDPQLCLNRASALLLGDTPDEKQRNEALHLIDLVMSQAAHLQPQATYWRSLAETHAGDLDAAASGLKQLLDPDVWPPNDPSRRAVLLPAWQLALTWHPELARRVGQVELPKPGRRLEAIAAAERALADVPDDAEAWKLKRVLYHELTPDAFAAGPVREFDYSYALQLGLALIEDPARWERGAEYLRMAAAGLRAQAPSIFLRIARACEQAGQPREAQHALEAGQRLGQEFGPKELSEEERGVYYAMVKSLAESAASRNDFRQAIHFYQLYTQYERSGLETLRHLAELHEKVGDALAALRTNEQALLFNPKDPDLLQRRDRYYYSVTPDELAQSLDTHRQCIDVGHCLRKARQVLDLREADGDVLDWAQHLLELVRVVQPGSVAAEVLLARALLRRGERDEALRILEDIYTEKPAKFASEEESESWYLACRLLGDLYLRDFDRPDLAVSAYTAYRASAKSGADTLFKIGEAYEKMGDNAKAARFYEQVTAYEEHPLAPEARSALYRVQS